MDSKPDQNAPTQQVGPEVYDPTVPQPALKWAERDPGGIELDLSGDIHEQLLPQEHGNFIQRGDYIECGMDGHHHSAYIGPGKQLIQKEDGSLDIVPLTML